MPISIRLWPILGAYLVFAFWGGEQLERIFGGIDPKSVPRRRYIGAEALVAITMVVLILRQPDSEAR